MISELRKIHNRKYWHNDRMKGLPIESKEFENHARFLVFEDYMAITTKGNGVLIGDIDKLEKLFKEALEVIETYRRN